ncbi:hypothetical protein O0544_10185 [Edwardsiella anguillarum]|nr:hypothetical protein [Edwardsiella anguillarum]
MVRGGGAGLQYASSAASATVNDSGLITLDSAGDATIQVTSPEDGQTASYTLNTPAVFVRPEFATQRNYSAARTYCIAQGGALAADQSVLQNVRMLWGTLTVIRPMPGWLQGRPGLSKRLLILRVVSGKHMI